MKHNVKGRFYEKNNIAFFVNIAYNLWCALETIILTLSKDSRRRMT